MGTRASAAAVKSAIAILLSLTLVAMSPGLFGYRALASVVAGASAGRGAVAGRGAAGAAVHGGLGSSSRLHSTLNLNLKIGSVIPSAQTLNVTKSISASLLPLRDAKVAEAAAVYNAYSTLSPIPQPVKYSAGVPHTAPGAASTGLSGVVADLMKRFAPVQLGRPGMKAAALRSGEFFDGARARRGGVSAIPAAKDMGASRHNGGLQSKAGLQAETAAQNVIPAPAEPMPAAQTKPSLWRSPYVRYGVPAAVIGATAIFFQANLLPIAVISGTLLFSILAHESAHVLGLRIWGDPTPKAAGRDFINPLMHIDPLGTLLVPAASLALSMAAIGFPLLFGWAKPIPVDFNNLKDVQHDAAKVAALGPLTNFALAGLSFAAYLALPALGLAAAGTAAFILLTVAKINLAMGLFNILPLPWLDGGKLLVSLFPKSLYARWTANPNLPGGYQSIFRRIYEGPANILSRMHVHNLDQVNGLTRAAMFATLGAFYALFFSTLSIPFLFLALPCGYDYWCIAEKVRSEQAVGEMMDLMSEWGSIIVQIAEDHDVESEVSARDVELNLVHAVDSFLEHLMTKEDFRSLSDAEKVKRFMAEFTEFAAKDLQNKAFTQDTVETIKKVLNDPRNQPFKDRLEKWLTEHEIFKKIHSPEAKKKYKDSAEAAKKERERGAGGGRMSGFIPLLGLSVAAMPFFLAGPAELLLAWVAGLGIGAIALMRGNLETSSGGGSHVPQHKIKSEVVENMRASTFWIHFTYGANEQQVVQALERLGLPHDSLTQVRMPTPDHVTYYKAEINAADSADAAAKAARALLQESLIESISMHPAAHGAFLDSQTVSMARMQPQAGLEATQLVVAINHSMSDAERNLFPLDHSLGAAASAVWTSATEMRVTAADAAQAAIFAARLGRDHRVSRIGLHRDTKAAVGIANTQSDEEAFNAEQEAADIESALPLTQAQLGKVARGTNSSLVSSHGRENLYWAYVTIAQSEYTAKTTIKKPGIREPSDVVEGRFYDLNEQGENYNIRRFRVLASHVEELVKDLVELAKDENVTRIVAHPALADALEVPADNSDPLIKTQAHDSVEGAKTMRIIFNSGTERADAVKFFKQQVLTRAELYRWEQEALIVHVRAAEDAAAISAAAAANDKVSAVRMSGEGMAALAALKESNKLAFDFGPETVKEDAPKGLDEKRAVLVTFAESNAAEKHAAFAEAFGLNIGKAGYDGNPNMVLYELPEVEDVAHFMNMLGEAAAADPDMPVLRIQAYLESDATPPVDVAQKAAAQEEEAGAGAEVQGRQQVAHRDAHTEWITFLQNQKLADGTSFTPKQVEAIAGFFRPVVPPAGERKHPVIGRTDEMKRVIPILSSPRGMINSVMLTGEAGTGKTAIFEGLAQLIEDAEHADQLRVVNGDGETSFLDIRRLRGRWFVQLDIDRLLASEDPINTLLGLLDLLPMLNDPDPRQGNRVILLLDEIQKLRMDPQGVKIMNALKTPIRDGKISIAGTTTEKEWKEYFDPDEALTSRFKRFKIDEPSVAETTEMLQGAKVYYEWMHDTEIDEEALDKAAHLTDQFDKEHKNPRKSVELIHSASEMARPDNIRAALALDIREHWRQLTVAVRKAAKALHQKGIASSIALPAEMYNRMAELVESTLGMYRQQEAVKDGKGTLTLEVLKRTLAENTGIDSGQLSTDKDDSARYVEMEKEIAKTVINQDKALLALANAIRRNKAGLSGGGQPMGKFLFAGPTGVGKTYIAKQLARFMFGSEKAYTRFDMSEFKESHNVARLIGSPPGYVGHGEGGQLTEAVRKKPYSVLLFDEIEKAHPTIWDIFLQVLDDGHLTDGEGRTVDFSNTIIIFTSNVGMDVVDSQGFSKRIQEQQQLIKEIDAVLEGKALDTETKKARAEAEAAADGERERLKALRLVAKREAEDALAAVETLAAELKTTPLPQLEPKLKEKRTLEAQYQRAWDVYLQLGERIKSVTAEAAPVAAADKSELLAQKKAAAGLIAELEKAWDQEIATAISEGIQARMRPEVINRLDEDPLSKDHWITFNRLNRANADAITKIELGRFKKLLGERHGTELEYDDDTIAFLAEYGFSPVYGARPLKQAIEKFVIDPLAQWILKEANDGANNVIGGRIRAYVDGGKIAFESLPVNEEKIERASLAGVAHDMTEAVMELVEKLAGDDSGGAPGEQLFDQLLREFRQEAGEYEEQSGEAAGVQLAFAPNAGIRLSKSAVTVESEHNNPGKKDKTMRGLVSQAAAEAKAAGYSPDAVELLKPEAGAQGESWLKSFIKHAKTMSGDAETKVSVSREIGDKALRIAVKTGHRMSAEEEQRLQSHFTGEPVPSFRAAQEAAEQANRVKPLSRDQDLIDFYRRISAIPGARMGYSTSKDGTTYWLEIPKEKPAPSAINAEGAAREENGKRAGLTPHEAAERAKTKQFLLAILNSKTQDGPKVNIAAAEGFGMLSSEEDLNLARKWLLKYRWADKGTQNSALFENAPLLMTMAHIVAEHGSVEYLDTVESILERYNGSGHYQVPSRTALTKALAALYEKAGLERTRQGYDNTKDGKVKEAARIALGKLGTMADLERVKGSPEAEIALYLRWNPKSLRKFMSEVWPAVPAEGEKKLDSTKWKAASKEDRIKLLKLIGRGTDNPQHDINVLIQILNKGMDGDRETQYYAAEAVAELVARHRMKQGLPQMLEKFLEKHSMTAYDDKWPVLLALLYTAQKVGGEDVLPLLEGILSKKADGMSSSYEQPFFETPITWAKVVVRNGLFSKYQTKIQEMLTSKDPMMVAAALYAISMERQRLGGGEHDPDIDPDPSNEPPADLPDLYIPGSPSTNSGGYNYGHSYGGFVGGRHVHYLDEYGDMHGMPGMGGFRRMPPMP